MMDQEDLFFVRDINARPKGKVNRGEWFGFGGKMSGIASGFSRCSVPPEVPAGASRCSAGCEPRRTGSFGLPAVTISDGESCETKR